MEKKITEARPKIEVVRVSSIERRNFRPLDGVQLRAAYSHVRVGIYCPEPETKPVLCESKPPIEHTRKFKKNLGPVSRLLRRRHHATCLATKSCDNIYSVNRNSNSLDWRLGQSATEQGLQSRQTSSLDWRVGRSVTFGSSKLHWRDATRSAEQLSANTPIGSDHLQTPSTKSKLVSLLRRLSPRLSRPGSKGSLQSSPTICPWVQVEYSTESIDATKREESQESDLSFQQELQLNELKKRMAGIASTSQVITKSRNGSEDQIVPHPTIRVQESDGTRNDCLHRAVHEDRGEEKGSQKWRDRDSRSGETLPGLEEFGDDSCVGTPVTSSSSYAASGLILTSSARRRTRPLSLAVQPLNYHRLDPDAAVDVTVVAISEDQLDHQHYGTSNMTSQESIGSCSLDVDRSISDRSENTIDSVSERTLHSLNLSCNGDQPEASLPGNLANGSSETLQKSHLTPDDKVILSNGHRCSPEGDQLTAKKPSYLGLACSISGYSGITRYDSKLREGFRSRDSSPGTRLITRDTSPAGFKSNENLSVPIIHHYPPKSQSISPLAMDRQNGFGNGMKEECKIETYRETRNSMSICQGFSEVDKGGSLHTTFPDISPIRVHSPARRSPGIVQVMSCGQQNKSFSPTYESSPKPSTLNLSTTSFSDTSVLNGSSVETEHQITNTSSSSEKSFIQQRVERLYGPGALAQGFFFKRSSTTKLNVTDNSFNKSSNNNNTSADNVNAEESLKNLPVLRHLRPEFRAQLPVVSPRRPTDGSEQIIKPLRRISPAPRKNEQQLKACSKTSHISESVTESVVQHNSSITSIPDQQPAAPKVVLPVLEPSNSSSNVPKQVQEAEKITEDKNGHYFLKLLKQETDRLLSLAASAEAELASGDPVALPEEAAGKLRSAAGKARLLASQKMQQFEGLCQKNINQIPGEEFPTTNEDLAGFWDMVMLQVVQVNELFDQIEKSRKSQWQEVCPIYLESKPPHPPPPRRVRKKPIPATKCPLEKERVDNVSVDTKKGLSKELKPSKACHLLHRPERSASSIVTNSTETNINLELFVSTYDEVCDVKKAMSKEKLPKQNIIIVERCIPDYTNPKRFLINDLTPFYMNDNLGIVENKPSYSVLTSKNKTPVNEHVKHEVDKKDDLKSLNEPRWHSHQTKHLENNINEIVMSKGTPIDLSSSLKENYFQNNTCESEFSQRPSISSSMKKTNSKRSQYNVTFSDEIESDNIKKPLVDGQRNMDDSLFYRETVENIHDWNVLDDVKIKSLQESNFKKSVDSTMLQENKILSNGNDTPNDIYSLSKSKEEPIKLLSENLRNMISGDACELKMNSNKKLNNIKTSKSYLEKTKGIQRSPQSSLQSDNSFKSTMSTMFKNKYNESVPILNNEKELTMNLATIVKHNKVIRPSTSAETKSYKHSSTLKDKRIGSAATKDSNPRNFSEQLEGITVTKLVNKIRDHPGTVRIEISSSKNLKPRLVQSSKKLSVVTDIWSNIGSLEKSNIRTSNITNITNGPTKQHQSPKPCKKEQPVKSTKKNETIPKEKKISKPRQRSAHAIVWSQSDSQPFIPLSQETLNQLGRYYRVGKHRIFTTPLKKSSNRLDKVKQYDRMRKESAKNYLNNKYTKRLFSNDGIINDYQDNSRIEIIQPKKLVKNDGEIISEVELVSSNYLSPCYANGDDAETMYLLDMKKLSVKREALRRLVSKIVRSMNKKSTLNHLRATEITDNNKDTSSKFFLKKEKAKRVCDDVLIDNDIRAKISSQQDRREDWKYNKLIYSHSVATFSLYAGSDFGDTKSLDSLETCLNLKPCDPMNSSSISMIKYDKKINRMLRSRAEDITESEKCYPLSRKGIEIYDVSNISRRDLSITKTSSNDSRRVFVKAKDACTFLMSNKIVPEKKSNSSPSQTSNATKRRITTVHKAKPTATSEANKKAREAREQARRQMIEERRRAMRSNVQKQDDAVKIFAPET